MSLSDLQKDLRSFKDPGKAAILSRFFKTAPGQYGHGDLFLGVSVPQSRKIAKKYKNLKFSEIKKLLESPVHEERLIGLLILVDNFKNEDEKTQKTITDFYINSTKHINSWDLVDLSADKILGEYLLNKPKHVLYRFARSSNIWERRIAILATYAFIKKGKFEHTLKIAQSLIDDKHDLIHKAVGWMLREVGNRDLKTELKFLDQYASRMPRTMLRYAIEKFPPKLRLKYLSQKLPQSGTITI